MLEDIRTALEAVGRGIGDWPALVPEAITLVGLTALILSLVTLIMAWRALRRGRRLEAHYQRLVSGVEGEQLEDALDGILARIGALEQKANRVSAHARDIDVGLESAIRQVRLVRYDAYGEDGAPNSFSLALLDTHGSGVVISSIAGRERTRLYAKPVTNRRSPHALSTEEQRAVNARPESDETD